MKAVVAAFNQEKALVMNLRMELFEALIFRLRTFMVSVRMYIVHTFFQEIREKNYKSFIITLH